MPSFMLSALHTYYFYCSNRYIFCPSFCFTQRGQGSGRLSNPAKIIKLLNKRISPTWDNLTPQLFFFKPLCYNQLFLLAKKKNWRAPSDACHEIQTVDTKGVELKNADNSLIWLLILVTWQTKLFRNSHVTTTWRAGWIIFKVISLRHLAGNHTYTYMLMHISHT